MIHLYHNRTVPVVVIAVVVMEVMVVLLQGTTANRDHCGAYALVLVLVQ